METIKNVIQTKDGSQIYYEKIGKGFPVVLLHGNHGNGQYFSKQIPILMRYFQLIVVDSRGQGNSTNLAEKLTFQLMVADIKAILDQENITRASFVGFSDGANLAMVFAATYPQRVHRLVLNAGNSRFTGLRLVSQLTSLFIVIAFRLLAFFVKTRKNEKLVSDLLLQNTQLAKADFAKITAPTLVIVGAHDVIKRSHSEELVSGIPNSEMIVIPHAGHLLARKAPAKFNEEILAFLNDWR